jgi:REP-associated tyrosine transposase
MKKRTQTGYGNTHFVTFNCAGRRNLLDTARSKQIVISVLNDLIEKNKVHVSAFVIMDDHVHAILWFDDDSTLPEVMKTWKRLSSYYLLKRLKEISPQIVKHLQIKRNGRTVAALWTRRYYDFYFYSSNKITEKIEYIHENPVRKGLVQNPQDYKWSSARWYLLGQPVGVKIEPGY